MDQRRQLIPAPAWALADEIDQAWTVVAAWLFGFSGLIGLYMTLTGLARNDPVHSLAAIPTGVLVAAAALVDRDRAWTLRLGAVAGVCGALVWSAALVGLPVSALGTTLPLLAFAVCSLLCGRAFVRRASRDPNGASDPPAPEPVGWIEDIA